ncbi:MAG: hypothetical protein KJ788_13340, partial [Gammaproteobacteria bacterium]|nr:hypothetical protein [Gammaproteobacteria bacterium]
ILPSLPAGQYTPLGPTVVLLFLDASQHQDNSDGRLASFSSRSSVKNPKKARDRPRATRTLPPHAQGNTIRRMILESA